MFKERDEKEIERINRLQRDRFDELVDLFDPPLPKGVPERLARIVAAARIEEGETVLDVGAGTGILVPLIRRYRTGAVYACDLSEKMLRQLQRNHPGVKTLLADVRDLRLPDASIDVTLVNACYPNIADKTGAFANLARMTAPAGRLVISHPMGRRFIDLLKRSSPFPLDDFPEKDEAADLFEPLGFSIETFTDEAELYLLVAEKRR